MEVGLSFMVMVTQRWYFCGTLGFNSNVTMTSQEEYTHSITAVRHAQNEREIEELARLCLEERGHLFLRRTSGYCC